MFTTSVKTRQCCKGFSHLLWQIYFVCGCLADWDAWSAGFQLLHTGFDSPYQHVGWLWVPRLTVWSCLDLSYMSKLLSLAQSTHFHHWCCIQANWMHFYKLRIQRGSLSQYSVYGCTPPYILESKLINNHLFRSRNSSRLTCMNMWKTHSLTMMLRH